MRTKQYIYANCMCVIQEDKKVHAHELCVWFRRTKQYMCTNCVCDSGGQNSTCTQGVCEIQEYKTVCAHKQCVWFRRTKQYMHTSCVWFRRTKQSMHTICLFDSAEQYMHTHCVWFRTTQDMNTNCVCNEDEAVHLCKLYVWYRRTKQYMCTNGMCVYLWFRRRPQRRRREFRSRSQHQGERSRRQQRSQRQHQLWWWRLAQYSMRNQVSSALIPGELCFSTLWELDFKSMRDLLEWFVSSALIRKLFESSVWALWESYLNTFKNSAFYLF